jgi:hypothetical protein
VRAPPTALIHPGTAHRPDSTPAPPTALIHPSRFPLPLLLPRERSWREAARLTAAAGVQQQPDPTNPRTPRSTIHQRPVPCHCPLPLPQDWVRRGHPDARAGGSHQGGGGGHAAHR